MGEHDARGAGEIPRRNAWKVWALWASQRRAEDVTQVRSQCTKTALAQIHPMLPRAIAFHPTIKACIVRNEYGRSRHSSSASSTNQTAPKASAPVIQRSE